ncbi:hypothetical protein [Cystobacter fuscus]|uniref:hypothetical protein n=1 Tax=Cystobacter fuscus TaxID=43 RepID=UPI001E558258|nr:hypothetical protein [Cystobacter fuscus]
MKVDVTPGGIAFSPCSKPADATSQEMVSTHPLACLETGGKVTFVISCSIARARVAIDINGPQGPVSWRLPPDNGRLDLIPMAGTYTITAEGCSDIGLGDTKIGTLEVGTGTGEDAPPGMG